jgi:hypothetical protein
LHSHNVKNYGHLPTNLVGSCQIDAMGFEVAASLQKALAASFAHIMRQLKHAGINQKVIASEMEWDDTVISQIKRGSYSPTIRQLDKLLLVINKHAATKGREFGPKDFFKDPIEILSDEAKAQGYELVKKSQT